jgi:hypothetical protein
VVKFRQLFLEIATDVKRRDDVIANSLTLASACIRHFCLFINRIVIYVKIPSRYQLSEAEGNCNNPRQWLCCAYFYAKNYSPHLGYHHDSNQSAIALKFMRWLEYQNGWQIQTRNSAEGEHKVRLPNGQQLKLDGYVQTPQGRNIAIEFLGCAWHGHDW